MLPFVCLQHLKQQNYHDEECKFNQHYSFPREEE